MTKKRENKNAEQLELFSSSEETDLQEELDEDYLELENNDDDLGFGFGTTSRDITIERELLTLKILREAILTQNPNDEIMADFANEVLPNLLRVAIGVTAKGGKWIDEKEQELAEQGETLDRRNAGDQSLNTHLLNGLFPANLIQQRLEKLNTTVKRVIHETERRLLIASFILHDFEKFDYDRFPEMPNRYKDIQKNKNLKIRDLSILEHREIIDVIIRQLKLDYLINPQDNQKYREFVDDILCTAYNTQRRWDTNWNFSEHSELKPKLKGDKLVCLAALACLADRLASIIKHPQDALKSGINNIVGQLSNRQLKLSYHSIAENRGVLTNVVNNALIEAHTDFNTGDNRYYEPLLYLPTGVIYLTDRNAPSVKIESIPERVVAKIKSLCAGELQARQTGFSRDGKGLKYADYYSLFFDTPELMEVGLKATKRILKDGKKPVSKDRSDNLIKFQQQNILSSAYDFKFNDDIRIDQIAELGDLVSRKIWGEKVKKIEDARKQRQNERKKNKKLSEIPAIDLVAENLICKVAELWNLSENIPIIREIQRINETLKAHKLKGNTGGVPYEWYFLAAKYLQKHPGIEDVIPVCEELIIHIAQLIKPIANQYELPDGWHDLRMWITKVVMLPETGENCLLPNKFLDEFEDYKAAKKNGRGKQLICSISHSSYTVTEQMESAVLFAPQVYTNKQMLGGSNAKRNISSIAGIEIMLRQILMSQTQATGGRFEDAKYRYLYFYPTYYCTPETNAFLHETYDHIKQTRFDTGVRNHFISKDLTANFELERYQNVDIFYLDENTEKRNDRTFKISYPEKQPLTFYFMALPPEVRGKDKKPTDTESWIMPAWLSLAFPMILDIKTVVSESPIPPFNDGAEFEQSVFLDSAPQAFRVLLKEEHFRLDYILEGWKDKDTNQNYPSPLNLLTSAYAIHLDVHSKQSKNGYDPNWGKFAELAKDFETSPLYIFAYLNEWVRKQKIDAPSINKVKLYAYHFYPCFDPYTKFDSNKEKLIVEEKSTLNHPKKLTELYRRFYRAQTKGKPPKANAILKPIDEAADVILKVDKCIASDPDTLIDVVAARLSKLMNNVHRKTAEGKPTLTLVDGKWKPALTSEAERQAILDFAKYFVKDVFEGCFKSDRARLAGRQLNLIRDTCEFLYRLADDEEHKVRPQNEPDQITEIETEEN